MSRPTPPRFTLVDLEAANDAWGCNCGPGALAAICGLTLDDVRPHLGERWPGYTNPTTMTAALQSLWRAGRVIAIRNLRLVPDRIVGERYKVPAAAHVAVEWPRWGLCRIQWEGPWTQAGVPMRARYRFTHWIGAAADPARGVGVFDINVLANGSGWCSLEDWSTHVAPVLAKDTR